MKSVYIGAMLYVVGVLGADPALVIYLQRAPYPVLPLKVEQHEIHEKAKRLSGKTLDRVQRKQLKRHLTRLDQLPSPQGFVALYNGYLDYANRDGQISFPLHHREKDRVRLVITPDLKLRKMAENSFAYQYIPDDVKKKIRTYIFERKTDQHQRQYWHVTREDVPDKKIDRYDVVLLTDPKNIYVDERDFEASKDANVVLPNALYVVGWSSETKRLLTFIDSMRWFEPITFEDKVEKDKGVGIRLMTNR